jgi:DNA gyrase subunit A
MRGVLMSELVKEILSVHLEDELKQSYLDYAMSVIVGRALPDARDGLKPVHRRILYAMRELGNDFNKPYKKSARIVGDVIGKYHPHGESAVYDSIVRMAQDFSLRYPLVDGQGNFGSVDGDSPAAMRYTEIRMSKMAQTLLEDLDKETVNMHPNYDETELIPEVLPARIPNLLVNGTTGIAVGMATNIPPHNLGEVIAGCLCLIDNPDASIDELIALVPGPDFPTRGIIRGKSGILDAYRTGRGKVYIRSRTEIEEHEGRERIIVHEIPYQVNKARLIEKIAELVKDKQIEGISGLRDESDKDGLRIVIEVKRGENAEVLLNNLFAQTQMQVVFGLNMVALVDNQPRTLNLKEILQVFIRHRREVVTRRTLFDLRKARERAHLLEGLTVALANIDEMIALIKASKNAQEAKEVILGRVWAPGSVRDLLSKAGADSSKPEDLEAIYGLVGDRYRLSPKQVDAILEMRLHRLTGLEQDKITQEYKDLLIKIEGFLEILGSYEKLMSVIREELLSIKNEFSDVRRTEITVSSHDLSIEDLIPESDMVITLSREGYVKAQPISDYQSQHRGGRGKSATKLKEEDFIEKIAVSSSHATILCFSSLGRLYWKKAYEFPQAGRGSRGRPMNNLLPLEPEEKITAMLSVRSFVPGLYVVMATQHGVIKKTSLEAYSRPRSGGIIALNLDQGDSLIGVHLTDGSKTIMLFSDAGKAVRFKENQLRPLGRQARGVRGIRLASGQKVISLLIVNDEEGQILTATQYGYGKRTKVSEYRTVGRGAQGVMSIQTTERNGGVIGAVWVTEDKEIMLITDGGVLVRTPVSEISCIGRNTQGVRLINLGQGENLIGIQVVEETVEASDASLRPDPNAPVVVEGELSDEDSLSENDDIDLPDEEGGDEDESPHN